MTIREKLGALYDLVAYHGDENVDLTHEQRAAITKLYNDVNPHKKIKEKFEKIGMK